MLPKQAQSKSDISSVLNKLLSKDESLEDRINNLESSESTALPYSDDNVTNPPTLIELNAIFGTASIKGKGFTAILNDGGTGTDVYLIGSDGTNWWYKILTKAL